MSERALWVGGVRCMWIGRVQQAAKLPGGLPCCPHCGSPLLQWGSRKDLMARLPVDTRPVYEFVMGAQTHFRTYEEAVAAFLASRGVTETTEPQP